MIKQPKEMFLLSLTEMCQRFALYGIGNLLVLYLVQSKHFPEARADHIFGIYTGAAFVLPVLGGYVADRTSHRWGVILGSIITAIGCFLVATGSIFLLYVAIGLIAVGTSLFTPSIYAILGSLYHDKHEMRDGGFSIYYAAVNLGVFLAMFSLGAVSSWWGWAAAFYTAAVIQLIGLYPFFKVMKNTQILSADLKNKMQRREHLPKIPLKRFEIERIVVICVLSLFTIVFWMAYNQGGSSMNLFALKDTNRYIGTFKMPPSWLLSSESLYLVILAFPLASLYHWLAKRKLDPSPPIKSALSFVALGFCFLVMMIAATRVPRGSSTGSVSPTFLFGAYFLMAIGEMLIAPIGLSLVTRLSPHRFTALLIGIWYLCVGIGFYLGGLIAGLMTELKTLTSFFNLFVIASFVCACLIFLLSRKLNQMRHVHMK